MEIITQIRELSKAVKTSLGNNYSITRIIFLSLNKFMRGRPNAYSPNKIIQIFFDYAKGKEMFVRNFYFRNIDLKYDGIIL